MRIKEVHQLKVIIGILMVFIGVSIALSMEIKIYSWPFSVIALILVGLAFSLIGFSGYLNGRGRFATEFNLDYGLIYEIKEVVNLKNGTVLFVLEPNISYKTQVLEEPHGGFKKFDVVGVKYLVPKRFSAKLVDGQLLIPVQ